MGFMWIILIGLAVYLIYLNNNQGSGPSRGGFHETPLDIIQKRYARGEITREQFEEMKKDLQ